MGRILGRHYLGLTHYFGHYLEQTRYLESTHCAGEREFRAPLPRSAIPSRILLRISDHCHIPHLACACKPACKPTAPVALGIDCAHWVDVKDPYSVIRNSHQLLVSSSVQQVEKHIGVDETMHNETNVAESHASEQVTRGLLLPPS